MHKQVVIRLKQLIGKRRRQISTLAAEHECLELRAAVAAIVLQHYEALLKLRRVIEQCATEQDVIASCATDRETETAGHEPGKLASGDGGLANEQSAPRQQASAFAGSEQCKEQQSALNLQVHWWPAAAEHVQASLALLNMESARGVSADVVRLAGCLLPRITGCAYDADKARQKLEDSRCRCLTHASVGALTAPMVLSQLILTSQEGPDGAPPGQDVLEFVVAQMQLTPLQEETMGCLLDSWSVRNQQLSDALKNGCERLSGNGSGPVMDLSQIHSALMANAAAHFLALFDSVLSIEQFASFSLATYPFTLSLGQIKEGLDARMARARGVEEAEMQAEWS